MKKLSLNEYSFFNVNSFQQVSTWFQLKPWFQQTQINTLPDYMQLYQVFLTIKLNYKEIN